MKQKFNNNPKISLVSKTFITCALTMFLFSVAAFGSSVKVYNNTSCVMKIYCQEGNQGTYDMGSLYAGQSKTIYPTANWGKVYCKNKQTGNYANGLDFGYGNYDLHVKNACPQDDHPVDDPVDTPDNTPSCDNPDFNSPCNDANILDFSENGYDWGLNDMTGSYTVNDQTFDININDPDGIFGAFQDVQVDPDDEGSYENNTGLAIGINPNQTSDELEITYDLSTVVEYVAFTIRDLDRKYYSGSQQIEEVCVYGYLDGVQVQPTITSLCGSAQVSGNCAVGTVDSAVSDEDESIRVVFASCINEIRIVYGNDDSAATDPTYSRIYIGDDIGFGTACTCTDPCTVTGSELELTSGLSTICVGDGVVDEIQVEATGGDGESSAWVITDQSAEILALPTGPPFVFEDAGEGTCLIWYLNWNGELAGNLEVGENAGIIVQDTNADPDGPNCAVLSNSIPIVRENCCSAASAQIGIVGGGETLDVCVNDANLQPVQFELLNAGNGASNAWVVTDVNGIILELFDDSPSLDFYASAEETCLVWYLTWDGDLAGVPQVGDDANVLVADSFCAELSNSVTINRTCCCPLSIQFDTGNLDCVAGNLFPEPIVFVDSTLIYPDTIILADGTEILSESIACYSTCSALVADIRNEMGTAIPGAIPAAGVYIASSCGDCTEDARLEVTQEDLDGCTAIQQGIVAPSICNGGMLADPPIVNSIFNNSATIQWNAQSNAKLQYKATDSDQWTSITQSSGFVIIPNLGSCNEYEVRLNYPCNNDMITSLSQRFTTAGCVSCENIDPQLVPLNVTGNSTILSWDIVPDAMYTLYYKTNADADWKTYNTVVPFVVIFGLDECSMYEFGLKVTCSNARSSNMSAIVELGNDCEGQKTASLLITDNSLINIYPNPASSFIDISLTNDATISNIEIYNVSGKLIFNHNDLNYDGMKYTAKLNNLANGLYFITAKVEGKVHTKKFLKE